MSSARLAAAKLRIVREAVQHNLPSPPPRRIRPPRHVSALPVLTMGSLLIASLVYVSLPPKVVSPVEVSAAPAPPMAPISSASPEPPRAIPQRLARGVLPLTVKRIVIDPGHGGTHLGAVARSGVTEKEITLDVALRLHRLLTRAGFEVRLTRDTDTAVSLDQRVALANTTRADLFLSIHVNWMPLRSIRSLETYHVGPTDDPVTLALARAENQDSGYSMAAYRALLEKVYIDTRREESRALARAVNGALFRSLSEVNPALEDRGVKTAPFAVLLGTQMPAILVEVSCLSNEEEVDLLTSAAYREQIAAALFGGIRAYARELDGAGKREG